MHGCARAEEPFCERSAVDARVLFQIRTDCAAGLGEEVSTGPVDTENSQYQYTYCQTIFSPTFSPRAILQLRVRSYTLPDVIMSLLAIRDAKKVHPSRRRLGFETRCNKSPVWVGQIKNGKSNATREIRKADMDIVRRLMRPQARVLLKKKEEKKENKLLIQRILCLRHPAIVSGRRAVRLQLFNY